MSRRKDWMLVSAGFLLGILITGPVAHAATEYLEAQRSYQPIYVDGKLVELEAYNINGANYVKLRDIGQAVDFEVYWDDQKQTVQVVSDQPYTGLPPVQEVPAPAVEVDYSQEAAPAVFGGELSREVYNAIRDSIVHRDEILGGSWEPTSITYTKERQDAMDRVTASMGNAPVYASVITEEGNLACQVKYTSAYGTAITHTQPFIDGLAGLSDREKVEEIAWYVCDRLDYSYDITTPSSVLSSDEVRNGNCMSYAHSFAFLCGRADIPCLIQHSEDHQWDRVYANGQWWDVDLTGCDVPDVQLRGIIKLLYTPGELQGEEHLNADPENTAFGMELLVPGSTK